MLWSLHVRCQIFWFSLCRVSNFINIVTYTTTMPQRVLSLCSLNELISGAYTMISTGIFDTY